MLQVLNEALLQYNNSEFMFKKPVKKKTYFKKIVKGNANKR